MFVSAASGKTDVRMCLSCLGVLIVLSIVHGGPLTAVKHGLSTLGPHHCGMRSTYHVKHGLPTLMFYGISAHLSTAGIIVHSGPLTTVNTVFQP